MPHPLVILFSLVILIALWLGLRAGYDPPVWLSVILVIVFSVLNRRSAKRQKARRERELNELRNKRVLHLDD